MNLKNARKNLVLIGAGKWGRNYIRTIEEKLSEQINLTVATRDNWRELVNAKPDGVIIATGYPYHLEIAYHCLALDIPILIEKPAVQTNEEAFHLANAIGGAQ